jgi:hypothetical protein
MPRSELSCSDVGTIKSLKSCAAYFIVLCRVAYIILRIVLCCVYCAVSSIEESNQVLKLIYISPAPVSSVRCSWYSCETHPTYERISSRSLRSGWPSGRLSGGS